MKRLTVYSFVISLLRKDEAKALEKAEKLLGEKPKFTLSL
jgi:hypothetical protein